jgi:hypothetical protein
MSRTPRLIGLLVPVIAGLAFVSSALAQTPPTRIRGTIAALDGLVLTIATREGPQVKVALDPNYAVAAPHKLDLAAIKPNAYIGTAAVPAADGTLTALEVVVIPEASRGSGDGHYAWDLAPGSTMTNANVDAVVQANAGRTLTLTYKGGTVNVTVPENVPIVSFGPAERADLKPGARVFVAAAKAADGSYTANRVLVEKDGVAPPI